MTAARYWRIVGIETYAGGDLELSELHLFGASGRVDATATLTSTIAPTAGTLAALQDDNLGTTCRFAAAAVRASGFALVWDFGAGNTAAAMGVRIGAALLERFLAAATLQSSSDAAAWVSHSPFGKYSYPGFGLLTEPPQAGVAPTTWNPADKSSGVTLSDGNLTASVPYYQAVRSVFSASSGAYYFEMTVPHMMLVGVCTAGHPLNGTFVGYNAATGWSVYVPGGSKWNGTSPIAYAPNQPTPVVVGFKLDLNAKTLGFIINGVDYGVAFTNLPSVPLFATMGPPTTGTYLVTANFGGSAFQNAVPAGYAAGFGTPYVGGTLFVERTLHTAASAAQIAASTPVPAFSTRRATPLQLARDVEFGGPGTIYGTTKTKGTPNLPTKARVVLQHQRSKLPVRETWSDPVTGAFVFTGVDTSQQFLALAEDAEGHFRPVAANRLTPEVL